MKVFFRRLPQHLQEKLKPLHKCERNSSHGRAHRFWIEADEIVYERQATATHVLYRVADVRMRVRKHLLIRDTEGKLIDDDAGDETEEQKHSAESQFAEAFTKHYEEIGSYFPELLRLKELFKLGALYVFAESYYQHLIEPIDENFIITHLTTQRMEVEYPRATSVSVESEYSKLLTKNNVSSSEVPAAQANSLRSQILSQLQQRDQEVVHAFTRNYCEQAHMNITSTATDLVRAWLNGNSNSTREMAKFISTGISTHHRQLAKPLEKLEIQLRNHRNEGETMRHNDNSCNWVPAAFWKDPDGGHCVYGGVNMLPKFTEGSVPQACSGYNFDGGNIFASRLSTYSCTPTAGPRNRQERQSMKQNIVQNSNNKDLEFKRTKYNDNYGPMYRGSMKLANHAPWNQLITDGKATESDKRIINGMSTNEGNLDSIHSYDSEIVSAGAMQKTVNSHGTGEFPVQVWQFKIDHPKLYEKHFQNSGWTVEKQKNGVTMYYNGQTGKDLKDILRKDFTAKSGKVGTSKPLSALVRAISTPEFQQQQITDYIDRLHDKVLKIVPSGYHPYTLNDYLQSDLGKATTLDHHINRPGYVANDFSDALNVFFRKYPTISKNPAEWGDKRAEYEKELIEHYGTNRRMTNPEKRFRHLKENLN